MRQDEFERGLVPRRAVLGTDWVERATSGATEFTAQWQDFITRNAWHAVWGQDGLDTPTRRLLAMTSSLALGRWEEFELHVHAALRAGIPEADLQDMLRLSALYCGVPAANTGFRIAAQALAALGRPSPPAPLTPTQRERRFHTFSEPQLHVVLQGPEHGTPVVLCHALGLDISMWSGVAAHLAARGYPVMRYDLRGHGASALTAEAGIDTLVDDAARLVREWGRGPVVFVGLSLGGMVAQGLAIRYPAEVRALVLANTVAAYPAAARQGFSERAAQVRAAGMAGVVDMVLQRYVSATFQQAHPAAAAALRRQLLRCPAAGYAACCEALADVDWLNDLGSIRVPTLVLSGESDTAAPRALQEELAGRLAQAPVVRHTVLNCAHLPTMEAPSTLIAALESFLTQDLDRLARSPSSA